MIPLVALSVLIGVAAGFPLLQWGLRREPASLSRFERRCRLFFLPLLALTAALLAVLHAPLHAVSVIVIGIVVTCS